MLEVVNPRAAGRRRMLACGRSTPASPIGDEIIGHKRGKIHEMVTISERPAEVEDRAVPRHWERDLIIGATAPAPWAHLSNGRHDSCCCCTWENNYSAKAVEEAMRMAITTLPDELMRSVTWDQGSEMSNHRSITVATGVPIYFYDPHSPPASRVEREHHRPASPVHAQGNRPFPTLTRRPNENSAKSQRTTTRDAWL